MRLERLEIHGFKSFSDRSELAFDKGVTAIVGPNGCGKSNVADAITWVMGEQSAKSLRGERMEDVIFNGSDARKPTAAAEVRLRLTGVVKTVVGPPLESGAPLPGGEVEVEGEPHSAATTVDEQQACASTSTNAGPDAYGPAAAPANGNGHRAGNGNGNGHANGNGNGNGNGHGSGYGSDHESVRAAAEELIQSVAREVEVTRRLYRSGESEYLIDGQVCRLRDVHELLMDTGLGAKAYAIIEQGKIGMILSSRPADRRQLIEEAAGITKYKSRRRAAELKLEAAQQNLNRIDDIVFEVEKQTGTLKRQAARARRYQKLRNELRRWEKVLFSRRYRQLAETIESARTRLSDAREREAAAGARVASIESDLGGVKLELAGADERAAAAREAVHVRELALNTLQKQIEFDREQVQSLEARRATMRIERDALAARRAPARLLLDERRAAAADAAAERESAARTLVTETEAYDAAHREFESLEADVEAARSEVFSAINSATALRHALEHAATARDRVAETLSKLEVESNDVRIESERAGAAQSAAADALRRAQEALEATRIARSSRESELASARIEHEWRARALRSREQEMAALDARLKSLEELDASRAGYGDAARAVLVRANGQVNQKGAVADYLDVDAGYDRAVEAALGNLLEHVVVERPEEAAAGVQLVREQSAGRCGFLIAGADVVAPDFTVQSGPEGLVPLSSVARPRGAYAGAIRRAMGEVLIADSFERAAQASMTTVCPVVTLAGDLFRGPYLLSGGGREDARGILETKREIRELRESVDEHRDGVTKLTEETASLDVTIAHATAAISALSAEHHRLEKAIVAHELQLQRAAEELARLDQRGEQLGRERRQAEDERTSLEQRQQEAIASIARLDAEQRDADDRLAVAQKRLFEAREAAEVLSERAAEARAAHAALVERAGGLEAEVARLYEAAAELEARAESLGRELDAAGERISGLHEAIASQTAQLDTDVVALEHLRRDVSEADSAAAALRASVESLEAAIRSARGDHDTIRTIVSELDVARATAEADLTHLANTCLDAVQMPLDEVIGEIEALERDGHVLVPDARMVRSADADSDEDVDPEPIAATNGSLDAAAAEAGRFGMEHDAAVAAAEQQTLSAEEAIVELRAKIDRLGPVNMMAIEQHEELETRYTFLTAQRRDLVASIAQTGEAIKRIDETTRHRFSEAFAAINRNFQGTFATLFGGGRAGLTLLDENDPLESGIEIIAQPPGKRLQSAQLLSGGEKALTAIALMFAMFKFKPSPFCLLDEIDAPLDDANIGRFVEMLKGMQQQTQFIVITHNRKTMEIADRLYGVTMEEPGVSKLISVQVN